MLSGLLLVGFRLTPESHELLPGQDTWTRNALVPGYPVNVNVPRSKNISELEDCMTESVELPGSVSDMKEKIDNFSSCAVRNTNIDEKSNQIAQVTPPKESFMKRLGVRIKQMSPFKQLTVRERNDIASNEDPFNYLSPRKKTHGKNKASSEDLMSDAKAYIPYEYARFHIAKVAEDMHQMRNKHRKLICEIEESLQASEKENQEQCIQILKKQYSDKLTIFKEALKAYQEHIKKNNKNWEQMVQEKTSHTQAKRHIQAEARPACCCSPGSSRTPLSSTAGMLSMQPGAERQGCQTKVHQQVSNLQRLKLEYHRHLKDENNHLIQERNDTHIQNKQEYEKWENEKIEILEGFPQKLDLLHTHQVSTLKELQMTRLELERVQEMLKPQQEMITEKVEKNCLQAASELKISDDLDVELQQNYSQEIQGPKINRKNCVNKIREPGNAATEKWAMVIGPPEKNQEKDLCVNASEEDDLEKDHMMSPHPEKTYMTVDRVLGTNQAKIKAAQVRLEKLKRTLSKMEDEIIELLKNKNKSENGFGPWTKTQIVQIDTSSVVLLKRILEKVSFKTLTF
ncbi:uncharacterized protein LOC144691273 [Cetorhinus maximus]